MTPELDTFFGAVLVVSAAILIAVALVMAWRLDRDLKAYIRKLDIATEVRRIEKEEEEEDNAQN